MTILFDVKKYQKNTENNLLYRVFNMSKINAAEMLLQIRRKITAFKTKWGCGFAPICKKSSFYAF